MAVENPNVLEAMASVNADGDMLHSSGFVSATRPSTGVYHLVLRNPLTENERSVIATVESREITEGQGLEACTINVDPVESTDTVVALVLNIWDGEGFIKTNTAFDVQVFRNPIEVGEITVTP